MLQGGFVKWDRVYHKSMLISIARKHLIPVSHADVAGASEKAKVYIMPMEWLKRPGPDSTIGPCKHFFFVFVSGNLRSGPGTKG